jgi:YidC/Oxa1 family membrane protein insertase
MFSAIISFFHTILYVPIYNVLIFLIGIMPHGDVGLALIVVVILVRLILLPFTLSMAHTQRAMTHINPEIKALQEKHKDDKETLAKETFALYKKYKINPFSSILTLFIQIPVLLSLYYIVRNKALYQVQTALLYPFVHAPAVLSPLFLGFFVISSPNIILAVLGGITQFLYGRFGMPIPAAPAKTPGKASSPASMQEEMGRAMTMQMRYVLPIIIVFIGYTSGAIALYFITSNIIMLLQAGLAYLIRRTPVATTTPAVS